MKVHSTPTVLASVNLFKGGWVDLRPEDKFFSGYRPKSLDMKRWKSGMATEVVSHGDHIHVVLADKVSSLPDILPEWIFEARAGGLRPGEEPRPNGIMLSYAFSKDDVAKHGLPEISELKEAFKRDGSRLLREFYDNNGSISPPQPTELTLTRKGMPSHWQEELSRIFRPAKDIAQSAAEAGGSKKNTVLAALGPDSWTRIVRPEGPVNRRAALAWIAGGIVAGGATLYYLNRQERETESPSRQ